MPLETLDRTPPPFFKQGPSALSKLVLLSALALFLMVADARFHLVQPLRAAIATVLYPGLPEHPGHAVAAAQMRGFGGMISVRMGGGRQAAEKLCAATRVFILAESLGGVESLIEHPGAMTHASTAGSQLEVPDDLVRLSVGIEDIADLLADLEQALG